MKELFNKLSNLFSFGKEARMVNIEGGPDMTGPEFVAGTEHTLKEESKLTPEQKAQEKAVPRVANAYTALSQYQKPLAQNKPELTDEQKQIFDFEKKEEQKPELTDEEKEILDFEKPGGETVFPKQAEYVTVERVEASKGREVKQETSDLLPIAEQFDLTVKEGYEDAVKNMLFGRQKSQDMTGTSWRDAVKYFNVLKESGDIDDLIKIAEQLHDSGNTESIESFEFWIDKNVRDRTRTQKAAEKMGAGYLGIEKSAIIEEAKNLIADFKIHPSEEGEQPVYVAKAGTEEKSLSGKKYGEALAMGAGEESDDAWKEEEPGKTPAEEVAYLQRELFGEDETRVADISERGSK